MEAVALLARSWRYIVNDLRGGELWKCCDSDVCNVNKLGNYRLPCINIVPNFFSYLVLLTSVSDVIGRTVARAT